jgi:flavin-binding protein dodecin
MSVVKVIEIISEGDSIENAVAAAVDEASKTVRNIKTVYIKDIQAIVQNDKVVKYRIDTKISFVVGT